MREIDRKRGSVVVVLPVRDQVFSHTPRQLCFESVLIQNSMLVVHIASFNTISCLFVYVFCREEVVDTSRIPTKLKCRKVNVRRDPKVSKKCSYNCFSLLPS